MSIETLEAIDTNGEFPSEQDQPAGWPTFDYGSAKSDYAQKRWKFEDTIDRILEGKDQPASREEAIAIVQDRFGCAYHMFCDDYYHNAEIRRIADVQSGGHELSRPRLWKPKPVPRQ